MAKKRPQMTSVDYVVIALSPLLIMVLVGSLCFFLLEVFYRGGYSARLHWIMFWFVVATVGIARISMEEGTERASVYSLGLVGAVAVAVIQFLDSPWIAWALMALAWWCAHKLTWDCTLIDDEQDASGEGLLQVAGLEEGLGADGKSEASKNDLNEQNDDTPRPPAWWQRFFESPDERRKRPHAPGVWVIYFSLAALPLFGLGQALVPAVDLERRRQVFWLLVWYVASGMGLLLTTSFLGLRRYLRQRKLEMPTAMTGTWLGVGAALIAALILVTMLVPRPNPEYPVENLIANAIGSPFRQASRHAVLRDSAVQQGPAGATPGAAPESNSPPGAKQQPAEQQENSSQQSGGQQSGGQQSGGQKSGGQKSGGQKSDRQQSGGQQIGGQQSGGQQSGGQQSGGQKSGGQKSGGQKSGGQQSGGQQSGAQQSGGQKSGGQQSGGQQSGGQQSGAQQSGGQQSGGQPQPDKQRSDQQQQGAQKPDKQGRTNTSQSKPESQPTPPQPSRLPNLSSIPLASWVRWLMWALLAMAASFAFLRYRTQVIVFLRQLWAELLAVLRDLFGPKKPRAEDRPEAERREPPRPFAAFRNPFSSGQAKRLPPEQLVRYTFEALEAWSFERQAARRPEETPLEFAETLNARFPALAPDARQLARFYSQLVYARSNPSRDCLPLLERLWGQLSADCIASGVIH